MESNNGSTYYNIDFSRSFNSTLTASLTGLRSHPCSEVLIINKTGQDVYIYDNNVSSDSNRLLLSDTESIVLRGVTNSSSVSAKTASGTGTLYYRAQMYSNLGQR